jgi:hypothetical protein
MNAVAAIVTPTEDQIFDTVWAFISGLFDPSLAGQFVKASQNMTSTPLGTYVIIQRGIKVRQDQALHTYALNAGSGVLGTQNVQRGAQYSYQVNTYGPLGPDWADTIVIAWRSMWAADYLAGPGSENGWITLAASIAPLYADEPQAMDILNAEMQYEQSSMFRLYLQANQVVGLPQTFFDVAPTTAIEPPVDTAID